MALSSSYPLDLQRTAYSYVERHNSTLVGLVSRHVLAANPKARILDVGCGAGGNGRALRARHPGVFLEGVEPNERAAASAGAIYDSMFNGRTDEWLARPKPSPFDAVVLSDVLEHIPDPVAFLRQLASSPALKGAAWVISVPNYAVWYNRLRTVAGRFDYTWSGLYDRTHLRFFTRRSVEDLLQYVGFDVVDRGCTPSLVQSVAPVLRRFFDKDVEQGEHLTLTESPAYSVYEKAVEPVESAVCRMWPELLGFQIVTVARLAR